MPLRLILHLAAPPADKLLSSPSVEACKQAFMGQLKEADSLRWGNTKRVTGLRKQEQDGIWDGLRDRKSPLVSHVCGLVLTIAYHITRRSHYTPHTCPYERLNHLSTIFGSHHRSDNFDDFWRVASKIFPVPSLNPPPPPMPIADPHPRSQSTDPGGAAAEKDGAYNVRTVPCRIYLPDGPVLQDIVPPLNELGK